jgi:hypothetical protein
VVFGFGTLTELAGEIQCLKCSRAMLLWLRVNCRENPIVMMPHPS